MILELHLSQAVKLITECGYPRNIREWPIKYIKITKNLKKIQI